MWGEIALLAAQALPSIMSMFGKKGGSSDALWQPASSGGGDMASMAMNLLPSLMGNNPTAGLSNLNLGQLGGQFGGLMNLFGNLGIQSGANNAYGLANMGNNINQGFFNTMGSIGGSNGMGYPLFQGMSGLAGLGSDIAQQGIGSAYGKRGSLPLFNALGGMAGASNGIVNSIFGNPNQTISNAGGSNKSSGGFLGGLGNLFGKVKTKWGW